MNLVKLNHTQKEACMHIYVCCYALPRNCSYFLPMKSIGVISSPIFFFLIFIAMVPEYWLTEGGQSATGALLDHIIENHVASPHLANRAASQSNQFVEYTVLKIKVCAFHLFDPLSHLLSSRYISI